MSARRRIDPFARPETVGRLGRRRIDHSGRAILAPIAAVAEPSPTATLRIRRDAPFFVLVVPDAPDGRLSRGDLQALAAGRALTGADGALAIACSDPIPPSLASEGVDRVLALPVSPDPTEAARVLDRACATLSPRHIVFPPSEHGGDLARRLAASTGRGVAHAVVAIEEGCVVQSRGDGHEALTAPPPVLIVSDTFEAWPSSEDGEVLPFEFHPPRSLASDVQYDPPVRPAPGAVALAEADAILAGGNGVADWPALLGLAEMLNLPVGASRIAVDAGKVARSRQVGASGTIVSARSYLAFGISGAPQHLEGVTACEAVLAVNIDPTCAMMKRADIAIVADADEVVRALRRSLESGDA